MLATHFSRALSVNMRVEADERELGRTRDELTGSPLEPLLFYHSKWLLSNTEISTESGARVTRVLLVSLELTKFFVPIHCNENFMTK